MRISDWSSDVCSSDLRRLHRAGRRPAMRRSDLRTDRHKRKNGLYSTYDRESLAQIGTASLNLSSQTDRNSVVSGQSASVCVDLGGRGVIKKQIVLPLDLL